MLTPIRIALLWVALLTAATAAAEDTTTGLHAVETPNGLLVVSNSPDETYSFEIPGRSVKLGQVRNLMTIDADSKSLQFTRLQLDRSSGVPVRALLENEKNSRIRDFEATHDVRVRASPSEFIESDGMTTMVWTIEVPKAPYGENPVKTQLQAVTPIAGTAVVFTGLVRSGENEQQVKDLLVRISSSIKRYPRPLDVDKLRETGGAGR